MKRFTALTMAALMVFAVFAGVASAGDTVEIRSSVTDSAAKTWDANGFAGFWLDLDTGEFSENLTLTVTGGDTILEDTGVVYEAVPVEDQDPEYEFTVDATTSNPYNYSKIGFLAEEYFVVADDVATLSKILMDDDSSYTMRTGESLELGEGYALSPQQIDVDGNKVWLELTKDGEFVDDKIISTDVDEEYKKTWYYQMDLNDNDDVDVIMIHIDEVFQGQVDSLCVIDGIFQISDDPLVLEEDDEFNELTITGLGSTIVLTNDDNELDMPDDDTLALTETIGIRASEDTDRWYIYTEKTEPGTYEIRSSVTDSAAKTWDANGFAGFWLDLDTGEFSENLTLTVTGGDTILEDTGVVYEAVPIEEQDPEYEFTVDATTSNPYNYSKIGFLAEEYFVVADDVATLSKILTDDDSSYTMRTGESLELGEGYALSPQQIDVDGNKVWLELTKDGEFVDDKIISTDVDEDYKKTWFYQMDLNDNDDVDVIMIHIDEVFQGQVDSLCVIDGIFQISDDPLALEEDDEFDELTITGLGSTIVLTNDDNELDMPDDDTLALTDSIGIRASEDTDRWYIYTEATIAGEEEEAVEEEEEEVVEEEEEAGEEEAGEEEAGEEEAGEGEAGEEEAAEEEPAEEEPAEEEPAGTPGFEAVFAIAGLLAIAYLVRRN